MGAPVLRSRPSVGMRREAIVSVACATRGASRLDDGCSLGCAPPTPETLAAAVAAVPPGHALVLGGGEPTLRDDLPEVLRAARARATTELVVRTDGVLLADPRPRGQLVAAGMTAVRIPLHSAVPAAHDWLAGREGAARQALRAARACAQAALPVDVETVLARPTVPHLADTVELAARLGARRVLLRRLRARGAAEGAFVALSPRFGLIEEELERAVAAGEARGIQVVLVDLPRCAAPRVASRCAPAGAQLVVAVGAHPPAAEPAPVRCAGCPGPGECEGVGGDYAERFSIAELEPGPQGGGVTTAPRRGARPAARPTAALRASSTPAAAPPFDETWRVRFGAPTPVPGCAQCGDHADGPGEPEAARDVLRRLVTARQDGVRRVRIASAGSLRHPRAPELIAEAVGLGFPAIELVAEGSALASLSDDALAPIARLARVDVPWYGPDAARHDRHAGREGAFAATLDGIARVERLGGAAHGFAVLHDATSLADFAAAWADRRLPGLPAFRLSPRGGSLDELAEAGRELAGPTRAALAAVLPPCLLDGEERPGPARPVTPRRGDAGGGGFPVSGSDRLGEFESCRCTATYGRSCPGIPVGWRGARWTQP